MSRRLRKLGLLFGCLLLALGVLAFQRITKSTHSNRSGKDLSSPADEIRVERRVGSGGRRDDERCHLLVS
jgi:hypothetical protein